MTSLTHGLDRRTFLRGSLAVAGAATLGGCATGSDEPTAGASGDAKQAVTLQSSLSDPDPKAALESVLSGYDGEVKLNTVALETFRAQMPVYLNSSNPPDVLTWYAGAVANDYASKGFLLDLSELWEPGGACAEFSPALRQLSSGPDGTAIFVPTNYYWWGVFHRKSAFAEWGVEQPTTWDEFLALCRTLQGKGVIPLTMGTNTSPWVASGWFDYLNLRVNGATFHRELLAGEHSFDSRQVQDVMDRYAEILPFIDPRGRSYSWQDAVTPLVKKDAAMYLMGAFVTTSVPDADRDDIDFFRVPVIDPSLPVGEEAPTDGYFASAKSGNPAGTKALLSYLASAKTQQDYITAAKISNIPTSPDVDVAAFSPLVQKGIAHLKETDEITQFFNRDSSDQLQATADTALTKFLDEPGDVSAILKEWQSAADKVRKA